MIPPSAFRRACAPPQSATVRRDTRQDLSDRRPWRRSGRSRPTGPVVRLTENDPVRRSSRLGFLAIHSLPRRKPSGSQRVHSAGRHVSAAALTAAKSGSALLQAPARVIFAASSRRVRDEASCPPRIAAPSGRFGFQGTALYRRRQVWFGAGERPRRDPFLDFRLSPSDGLVGNPDRAREATHLHQRIDSAGREANALLDFRAA